MPAAFSKPKKTATRGQGRPTKLTPAVMAKLKEAFAYGLNDDQAAALVGVNDFTLTLWKRNPAFVKEIQGAVTERLLVRLKRIEDGENGWQGCGWILERLLPRQWAKPEVLVAVQQNLGMGGTNGQSFESIVTTDLEFARLREHESYQHRRSERPVREVETEVVPQDLSGTLVRADHPGGVIISESQAEENRRRSKRAAERIEALLATKHAAQSGGLAEPAELAPTPGNGALVPGLITMPTGIAAAGWWAQFTHGDGGRLVERAAAVWACETLGREALGAGRTIKVEFDREQVTVSEVLSVLERATGPSGWQLLLRKAGQG